FKRWQLRSRQVVPIDRPKLMPCAPTELEPMQVSSPAVRPAAYAVFTGSRGVLLLTLTVWFELFEFELSALLVLLFDAVAEPPFAVTVFEFDALFVFEFEAL